MAAKKLTRPPRTAHNLSPWPAIESVAVKGLFGKYSYRKALHPFVDNPKGPISLFYGRNGSGKTTLLKLIYAAVSPTSNEGLRNYVAKTPFSELLVNLADGSSVEIKKRNGLVGAFQCTINGPVSLDVEIALDKDGRVADRPPVKKLISSLQALGVDLLFVRDDRKIQTTYGFGREEDADELLYMPSISPNLEFHSTSQFKYITRTRPLLRDVAIFVEPVLSAVNEWLRDFAIRQGTTGDQDASLVYLDVIRALKRSRSKASPDEPLSVANLQAELLVLSKRAEAFIKYGLISQYPFDAFIEAISDAKPSSREHIAVVMAPFIRSISRRLDTLAEIQAVISQFQATFNNYLNDKQINVDVIKGVRFYGDGGEIEPGLLSSGEKQLTFLFGAALLSRAGNSIFIVDEPELSLNFEWQRTLVDSLLDITAGANTQFIMASHSIEILSKHRSSIAQLD